MGTQLGKCELSKPVIMFRGSLDVEGELRVHEYASEGGFAVFW